jgi:phosphatidylethanolamine-binding protein (PEBP) family uncharacterized protein
LQAIGPVVDTFRALTQNEARRNRKQEATMLRRLLCGALGLLILVAASCSKPSGEPAEGTARAKAKEAGRVEPPPTPSATPQPTPEAESGEPEQAPEGRKALTLTSPTILHHGAIPAKHTCDGAGTSPELRWDGAPAGVKSYAVVVDDADSTKEKTSWILFDIPPTVTSLPEGVATQAVQGAKAGKNRYVFRVYALDQKVDLPAGAARADLEQAMQGHFLGQAAIIALYARTEKK